MFGRYRRGSRFQFVKCLCQGSTVRTHRVEAKTNKLQDACSFSRGVVTLFLVDSVGISFAHAAILPLVERQSAFRISPALSLLLFRQAIVVSLPSFYESSRNVVLRKASKTGIWLSVFRLAVHSQLESRRPGRSMMRSVFLYGRKRAFFWAGLVTYSCTRAKKQTRRYLAAWSQFL